jgi:hypothetical protein
VYHGPIASPKFSRKDDDLYRTILQDAIRKGPNFAGHFELVKFQLGNGPVGAVIVDAKSGSVFHLPSQVVREDFFIYDTDCLALNKKWRTSAAEEDDDASALSFLPGSELLIVKRCIGSGNVVRGMEKSYFRWHGKRWIVVKRVLLPPPTPLPVP